MEDLLPKGLTRYYYLLGLAILILLGGLVTRIEPPNQRTQASQNNK